MNGDPYTSNFWTHRSPMITIIDLAFVTMKTSKPRYYAFDRFVDKDKRSMFNVIAINYLHEYLIHGPEI